MSPICLSCPTYLGLEVCLGEGGGGGGERKKKKVSSWLAAVTTTTSARVSKDIDSPRLKQELLSQPRGRTTVAAALGGSGEWEDEGTRGVGGEKGPN